jgi:carboxylesterase type B
MALISLRWLLGSGALSLALLAVVLDSFQAFILYEYEYNLPNAIFAAPVVEDLQHENKYKGSLAPGVEHFQNIFYAQDTSGQNRFAPPVPLRYARGSVVDATTPGAWCPQGTGDVLPFTSRVSNISENCLSLRIARPRGTSPNAKLPVMVWLHSGGHALGSAYEILYTPDGIVRQSAVDGTPLIFVAINYRLGIFGFATSEALLEAKQTNVGLRDQRAALEWVRDNIEVFGGDPEQVTAIGHSVGASDIGLHLTSYGGAKGVPFQRAVMMSGSPGINFNTMSDLVKNNTADIARKVDCVKGGNSQSAKTLACLRQVPFEILTNISVTAARTARPVFGEGFFHPSYDGDFILDRSSQLIRAGKVVKGIPIIASWTTNDGAWYPPPTTSTDEEVLASFTLWLIGLSEATKQRLLELYPLEDFENMVRPDYDGDISPQYYRAAQLSRDLWFTCPVLDFAWQYLKHGGVETSQVRLYENNMTRFTPVYKYMMKVPMWRVSHLSDIPYVLNVQKLPHVDNGRFQMERALEVSRRIVKFVTTGSTKEDWPAAFDGVSRAELESESPSKISLEMFEPHGSFPVIAHRSQDSPIVSEDGLALRKLFQRCDFINSQEIREQMGV